ncbi:MAG: DHH family phosphoesterase [Bacillus sp. (in: firmicutes)]
MYKLLSHSDLDGVGCGILAKLAFSGQVKVKYNSLSSLNREIEAFVEADEQDVFLLITDLSPDEENEQRLAAYYQEKGNVQLIDHHKTALHLNEYEWGHVAVEEGEDRLASATSLFYRYLIDNRLVEETNAVAEFVELVRQYDTWEWEKNDNRQAERLNALFFLMSIEEFEETMTERLRTSDHFYFDEFEKKLLDIEEKKKERYIRRKKREVLPKEADSHFAGVVYAESYHSELGNELGKEYPHLDYIAIVNMGGRRVSFRTVHNAIDVSAIAAEFGGGGHEKASGCSLSNEAYKQFVEGTFHLEPLREDAKWNRFNLKQSAFGSLYKNRSGDTFLLRETAEEEWIIEKNDNRLEQLFHSFEQAEVHVKRAFNAWLVRDEQFVDYLMEEVKKAKGDS